MTEKKAVHYGKVELIPGNICDSYVLDDGTAVISDRGVAKFGNEENNLLKNLQGFQNLGGLAPNIFLKVYRIWNEENSIEVYGA